LGRCIAAIGFGQHGWVSSRDLRARGPRDSRIEERQKQHDEHKNLRIHTQTALDRLLN
jgi:hypothetical protein